MLSDAVTEEGDPICLGTEEWGRDLCWMPTDPHISDTAGRIGWKKATRFAFPLEDASPYYSSCLTYTMTPPNAHI